MFAKYAGGFFAVMALTFGSLADAQTVYRSSGVKNVFAQADAAAERIGWLSPRDRVLVLNQTQQWVEIKRLADDMQGFTSARYLQRTDEEFIAYPTPQAMPAAAMQQASAVQISESEPADSGMAHVDHKMASLRINFRAEPDLNSRIVGILNKHEAVESLNQRNDFVEIRRLRDGKTGYLRSKFVIDGEGTSAS